MKLAINEASFESHHEVAVYNCRVSPPAHCLVSVDKHVIAAPVELRRWQGKASSGSATTKSSLGACNLHQLRLSPTQEQASKLWESPSG